MILKKTRSILLFSGFLLSNIIATICLADLPIDASNSNATLDNIFQEQPSFLPIDEAFPLTVVLEKESNTIKAQWQIAEGYYLYRKSFAFSIEPQSAAHIKTYQIPKGITITDEHYGEVQVFFGELTLALPVSINHQQPFQFSISYQGCAEAGLCYPPQTKKFTLQHATATQVNDNQNQLTQSDITNNLVEPLAKTSWFTQLLEENSNIFYVVLIFYLIGLLLTFTPCVLPMIPILSSIIVGQNKKPSVYRAFTLSTTYVFGIAFTYGTIGALVGYYGEQLNIPAYLQSVWIIIPFTALFFVLALSMFGFFELRLPKKLHDKLNNLNHQQQGGTYISVALMGILSSLIVSPCTSAPLIGAISFIATESSPLLGGSALFALGLGVGTPLIIIGTSEGKLLPKTGPWMERTKEIFGVILLGVGIWLLERVLLGPFTLALWAILFIISGIYMGGLDFNTKRGQERLWKALGFVIIIYGILLLIGASAGRSNPLQPLTGLSQIPQQAAKQNIHFKPIETINDLNHAFDNLSQSGQPFLLDFYADWCIYCRKMESTVFPDPKVADLLNHFTLLRTDVTNFAKYTPLLKHLNVPGPPALLFFTANGDELTQYRIIGEIDTESLQDHLKSLLNRLNISTN